MYVQTPVYQVGGDIVFGLMVPPIIADATDVVYTVTQSTANRLDLVANTFYGDPSLYWVLGDVNDITDIQNGVPEGTRLRIPSKSRLTALQILKG